MSPRFLAQNLLRPLSRCSFSSNHEKRFKIGTRSSYISHFSIDLKIYICKSLTQEVVASESPRLLKRSHRLFGRPMFALAQQVAQFVEDSISDPVLCWESPHLYMCAQPLRRLTWCCFCFWHRSVDS